MSSIELTAPRVISISVGGSNAAPGKHYLLTVARITKQQWLRYFEGIFSTSENQGGKRVNSFDSTSALVELVEAALTGAEGYATADGSAATSSSGWQSQIPLRHRLAVGEALTNVEVADPDDDEAIVLGAEPVYLNAVWGADTSGAMLKYTSLLHLFKTPSAEQQRRLSRDASRSRIVGGSRNGKTVWLGARATLAELYDELILSVQGYTVNGVELGADRAAIVAEMDLYHKVAAADALFSPASANVTDEEA